MQQYLPGLTMPVGHQLPDNLPTPGDDGEDGLEIENAYIEVGVQWVEPLLCTAALLVVVALVAA